MPKIIYRILAVFNAGLALTLFCPTGLASDAPKISPKTALELRLALTPTHGFTSQPHAFTFPPPKLVATYSLGDIPGIHTHPKTLTLCGDVGPLIHQKMKPAKVSSIILGYLDADADECWSRLIKETKKAGWEPNRDFLDQHTATRELKRQALSGNLEAEVQFGIRMLLEGSNTGKVLLDDATRPHKTSVEDLKSKVKAHLMLAAHLKKNSERRSARHINKALDIFFIIFKNENNSPTERAEALANFYYRADPVRAKEAKEWLENWAEYSPAAQFQLAMARLRFGKHSDPTQAAKEFHEAMQLLVRASEGGDEDALRLRGVLVKNFLISPSDFKSYTSEEASEIADAWFVAAGQRGDLRCHDKAALKEISKVHEQMAEERFLTLAKPYLFPCPAQAQQGFESGLQSLKDTVRHLVAASNDGHPAAKRLVESVQRLF